MMKPHAGIAVALVLFGASLYGAGVAEAGVTTVETVQIDPGAALAGFVTNDIQIDFEGLFGGQQMILELTQGSIFQSAAGGQMAPEGLLIDLFPEARFDSFVTIGGHTSADSAGVLMAGGAVDIDGAPGIAFDSQSLNIAWTASPGTYISSGDDFLVSRITLSNDAVGTLKYFGSTLGDSHNAWIGETTISGGVIGKLLASAPAPPALPPVIEPPQNPMPPIENPTQSPGPVEPAPPVTVIDPPGSQTPEEGISVDPPPRDEEIWPVYEGEGVLIGLPPGEWIQITDWRLPIRLLPFVPGDQLDLDPYVTWIDRNYDLVAGDYPGFELVSSLDPDGRRGDLTFVDGINAFSLAPFGGQSVSNIAPVPEPQTIWLALTALMAAAGFVTRRAGLRQ